MTAPNVVDLMHALEESLAAAKAERAERTKRDERAARRHPKGSECECTTCGQFFGSPSAFDRHLAPVGCRPPAEVRHRKTGAALFERTTRKGGPTWVLAGERPTTWGGAR